MKAVKTQSPIPLRPFTHKNYPFLTGNRPLPPPSPPPPGGGGGLRSLKSATE